MIMITQYNDSDTDADQITTKENLFTRYLKLT